MFSTYASIFRPRGAKGFAAAGFVARLPIAMAPIGIVAMLSQSYGEYWLAGAVAATFTLTNAFVAPQISRIVDRLGQFAVVGPAAAISVIAFLTLIVAANQKWPAWVLFASAFLAATMPSIPAMVRARWTALFRGQPALNTAFAFESVADELMYIVGASLSVGLSVALFPEAGVLASTVMLALGTTAFLAQRSTEPPIMPESAGPSRSAIRLTAVQIVTLAMIFIGAIFATAEVSAVAITEAAGKPEAATLVIGVYAIGSFIVGIIIGGMDLKMAMQRRLAIAIGVIAITTVPLLFADTVPLLSIAIFVSGLAISPTFITAFGLIERRVPPAMLTEGVTWVLTGIGIGMALGTFAAGWVVDTFGPQNGFWVSVICGTAAFVTVLLGQKTLSRSNDDAAHAAFAAAE